MFITKCKSEKFWKYVNKSAIVLGPDSQLFSLNITISIIKTSNASHIIDILAIEIWLDKKNIYKIGFEQVKKIFHEYK